jgi:hypothetical protein
MESLKIALEELMKFEQTGDWYYFSLAIDSLLEAIENEKNNESKT